MQRRALWALLLVAPLPTVGEVAALWLWPGTLAGQGLYLFSKLWMVLLPACWTLWADRVPWRFSPASRGGFGPAMLWSLPIVGAIVGAYVLVLHYHWISPTWARSMVSRNRLNILPIYVTFSLLTSTANALMEEYAWRWFVFEKWRQFWPAGGTTAAAVLTALLFTVHHASALKLYFNWPITALASLGVLIGSLIWSGLYVRYRSIWPGFVSHILADLAIFGAGWHLIFAAQ